MNESLQYLRFCTKPLLSLSPQFKFAPEFRREINLEQNQPNAVEFSFHCALDYNQPLDAKKSKTKKGISRSTRYCMTKKGKKPYLTSLCIWYRDKRFNMCFFNHPSHWHYWAIRFNSHAKFCV